MTKQPKVSVIVPIYGVEKYLHQCVDSILAQTLQDIEIILVDDGSKDKCPQIVDEYAKKDKRIIAIHKPNGGYGSAVNCGLDAATGEYIGIVEPDDWIAPDMYETLYTRATETNAEIVKSKFIKYFDIEKYEVKKDIYWFSKNKKFKPVFTLNDNPEFLYFHPSIWSAIYKRELIENNNIRLEPIHGAGWTDNLFQVQTMCLAQKISYINKGFYYYRQRNWDDALDLKDYTIPFLRTKTIHAWLAENKITNPKIWANLYKRELAYLHIIFRTTTFKKLKDITPLILEWQKNINPTNLLPQILDSYELRILRKMNCFSQILLFFITYRYFDFKKWRRFFISLHWSKYGYCFQLFGIKIATGKFILRPSLITITLNKENSLWKI